jgi:serine acetyltransferase
MTIAGPASENSLHTAWQEPDNRSPVPFWPSVRADVLAHYPVEDRPRTRLAKCGCWLRVAATSSGFHAVILYRMAHCARGHLGLFGKAVAFFIHWFVRHWYGSTLSPAARLYGGLILPHPQSIVIGPYVVLGPRTWIFQNVTLGGAPGKTGMPKIGSDARILTGAVVSGPVLIGDGVTICANCVVSRDVSGHTVVRPAPIAVSAITPESSPMPSE